MSASPFQSLAPGLRAVPAVLLTLVLALLSVRAYELSSLITLQLLLVLHPLYYWTIFRPALFPAWLAFLLGFAFDMVSNSLLGLTAFLLVLAQLVIVRQRRYLLSQSFATQWAGFLLMALGVEGVRWAVMGLATWRLFSPASAFASGLCNAALYSLTSLVMLGCLRLISGSSTRETLQD